MPSSVAEPRVPNQLTDPDWRASNTTTTLAEEATLSETPPGWQEFPFPFGEVELVIGIVGDLPAWVEPTVRSTDRLLRLGPDWDTYGGCPVDLKCAVAAIRLAFNTLRDDTPVPSVVPTSRGGLQLEWHTRGVDLEIEFLSATRVCGLFEDQVTGACWEEDLTSNLWPLAAAISVLTSRR